MNTDLIGVHPRQSVARTYMKKRYWIAGAATLAIAGKLLARPRDADWHKNRHVVFHSDHSRFLDVDGMRVHFQEAGDANAPALILIHGFASSTLVWSKVFLRLAHEGYRVIAVDLLGYGYSAKPRNGEYTIAGQAKLLLRLLDHLGIEKAVFVGSSYGGAVAAPCALEYSDRGEKLVLVGTVNNNQPFRFTVMRLFGSPPVGEVVSPLLIGSRPFIRRAVETVFQ